MPSSTSDLKKFAQSARRSLREQVAARLDQVLHTDSAALREREAAIRDLNAAIAETSRKAVIDRVAYTWFNRFCALRFMDANGYNRIRAVSPAPGFTQPEILKEAKQGYIDEDLQAFVDCAGVFDLLSGRRPSADAQQEAYRMLVVGMCNALNKAMPFLFEPIADYTELLMPQDLLSDNSILADLREAMTEDACADVEVIGWLYQFYISERKDEVFEALKQNQKIAPEDIPAATQLFTPHWIVRYLVENSLGRLWMLNRPQSRLVEKMDYYISPQSIVDSSQQQESPQSTVDSLQQNASSLSTVNGELSTEHDFLRITSPEEIKICDPACGSGHMLTYAFDLLYAIYEEEGYAPTDIPRLILEKNLYGIEIDERAGSLAAFALFMKARDKDRHLFTRGIMPNICVLENITFTDQELKEYAAAMGQDLFTEPLLQTLRQFEQAKNFGSLIRPVMTDAAFVREKLERKGLEGSIFLYAVHRKILRALEQANYLRARKYHIIVTNPPYKGRGELNIDLQLFMEEQFPLSKGDLFACFIERSLDSLKAYGLDALVTMQAWLFIDSFKDLRAEILDHHSILNLIQIGFNSFPELNSKYALAAAFTIQKEVIGKIGDYISLNNAPKNADKNKVFFEQKKLSQIHRVFPNIFKYIDGSPISFETPEKLREVFSNSQQLGQIAEPKQGMATGDNDRFVRIWSEVSKKKIGIGMANREIASASGKKWFPYNKGGGFRKWYGNQIFLVNWESDGLEIFNFRPRSVIRNVDYYFRECLTWSLVGLTFGPRYTPQGFLFDVGGSCAFLHKKDTNYILAFMASTISSECLVSLNPTLNFQVGDIYRLPIMFPTNEGQRQEIDKLSSQNIEISREDWDLKETSWDFSGSPLLSNKDLTLEDSYNSFCKYWTDQFKNLLYNENKLNELFIDLYHLEKVLSPIVDPKSITVLDEITFFENGHLKFSSDEIVKQFLSYSVGCMFGRYSLDKPGLVLANQGETLADYLRQIPDPTFMPDEDNAIPILAGEWFSDDITERFKKFLKVTFGEQHYEENLSFIEQAVGRDIRSYFLKDFYPHHLKMYQKRPIYWLFSSPKGSFNVLIYMHRYRPDTLSVILNRYLREFKGKLEGRKRYLEQVGVSASSTQREKTGAVKEIEGLNKTLEELRVYERDILYPLAAQGIDIDLDDGVKVNYARFGKAVVEIK